jgi:hypothetical protein
MIAEKIISYCKQLKAPVGLPSDVGIMNPYASSATFPLAVAFYQKYYADDQQRIVCFGINPGRFGGGLTGVPFTDPIHMEQSCGIPNSLPKKAELSAKFIYEMIAVYGGPEQFYQDIFISAVSPLGYTRAGVNLNYYDIKGYQTIFEPYALAEIQKQLSFGLRTDIAFCFGSGKNADFLRYLSDKYELFDEIQILPHPRWIMQYRLKQKADYINQYITAFTLALRKKNQ